MIIEALYQSAKTKLPVELEDFAVKPRPSLQQEIRRTPVEEPPLVHAEPPSG